MKEHLPEQVRICEVAPRDGFQVERRIIPTEQKLQLIEAMADTGVSEVEITAFVHPKLVPGMADADEIGVRLSRRAGVVYRALVPNLKGAERAARAHVDKVKLMLSATDAHSQNNANAPTMQALAQFRPAVRLLQQEGIVVGGSIAVAFGCPFSGPTPLERLDQICAEYLNMGVREVSLADTAGTGNPVLVHEVVSALRGKFPELHLTLHLHNTRGLAFANALAGLMAGVDSLDASAGGLGGCPFIPHASGNIATEDLVQGLEAMGIETGVNLKAVLQVAADVEQVVGHGLESFTHRAGMIEDLIAVPARQTRLT